jgi:ABC-2 type transport system permease protein
VAIGVLGARQCASGVVPVIVNGFFVAAFSLTVSSLMLGVRLPAGVIAPLVLVIAVSTFSCTGLGLVAAGIGLIVRETSVLSNIVFGVLLVFTGANVPLREMPDWIATVAQGMPFTHGIAAARSLADGASLAGVGGQVGGEFLVGSIYAVAGYAAAPFVGGQNPQSRHARTGLND